jgi:hypothetical protein
VKTMANKRFWWGMMGMALVFGMTVIGTSCTTFSAVGLQSGIKPGVSDYEILGRFEEKKWVNKFLGSSTGVNLFNITSRATNGAVERAITQNVTKMGGTGAIDIEIAYWSNPLHWILNTISFGIYAPVQVTVKGTVIRQIERVQAVN